MVKKSGRGGKEMVDVNRGSWTAEEDQKLADYVQAHGDKKWRCLPEKAGLKRCGKSCRLRWLNYLRPGIKRGNISQDEEDLIIRLHNLIGNRWSLIAGRLPGRTDNEIKNHWNTHLSKRSTTIEDLNTKQTKGLINVQDDAPPLTISVDPDTDIDPQNVEQTSLSDDLSESDFDIDQLFKFTGEPILEPNYDIQVLDNDGKENSMPEGDTTFQDLFLQVKENSMPAGDTTSQDLLNHAGIDTQGSYAFDSQVLCNSFQFDDLDQLMTFQDYALYN